MIGLALIDRTVAAIDADIKRKNEQKEALLSIGQELNPFLTKIKALCLQIPEYQEEIFALIASELNLSPAKQKKSKQSPETKKPPFQIGDRVRVIKGDDSGFKFKIVDIRPRGIGWQVFDKNWKAYPSTAIEKVSIKTPTAEEQSQGKSQEEPATTAEEQSQGESQEEPTTTAEEQSQGESQEEPTTTAEEQSQGESQEEPATTAEEQSQGESQEEPATTAEEQSQGESQEEPATTAEEQSQGEANHNTIIDAASPSSDGDALPTAIDENSEINENDSDTLKNTNNNSKPNEKETQEEPEIASAIVTLNSASWKPPYIEFVSTSEATIDGRQSIALTANGQNRGYIQLTEEGEFLVGSELSDNPYLEDIKASLSEIAPLYEKKPDASLKDGINPGRGIKKDFRALPHDDLMNNKVNYSLYSMADMKEFAIVCGIEPKRTRKQIAIDICEYYQSVYNEHQNSKA